VQSFSVRPARTKIDCILLQTVAPRKICWSLLSAALLISQNPIASKERALHFSIFAQIYRYGQKVKIIRAEMGGNN
jgi:hypothetical protein